MTEDEAQTKSCPRTLEGYEGLGAYASTIGTPCIASKCMAWRWIQTPDEAGETRRKYRYDAEATGFCGLGGRP